MPQVDKAGLNEVKSVGQGNPDIQGVLSACLVVQSIPKGKISKETNWSHAKKALGSPATFLELLQGALKLPETEEESEGSNLSLRRDSVDVCMPEELSAHANNE